ncbi:MAG: peptidoglycan DD-metalloendopeptidase family protein [Rhodobacteraceae bacterium]|nr:peptidoglycan DD-metalloendopeptidase family protein [Paracoccaceae bacterium]
MKSALALLLAILIGFVQPALAQTRPAKTAEQAAADLRQAIEALKLAESGKDRIAALTATIRAYETGLAALRQALRGAAVRETEISAGFQARRDQLGQILGVMSSMEQNPAPLLMLHPSGPLGTARSGMILASVAPAVQSEADRLKAELTEMRNIRTLQEETAAMLQKGLDAAQAARTALAKAIQDRTDLPRRYLEDPEELRTLVDNADTLDAFATGLARMETDISPPRGDFAAGKGSLSLPVLGSLLRKAGAADAAGITRPGLLIASHPAALVTTPWAATIRYRGPLLDYGNVMILEPATGYLLVLAGMGSVYGETGDVLGAGDPVGLMGGAEQAEAQVGAAQEGSGAGRTETLYIELRQGGEPIDPGPWFVETKEN